jgi:IS30 family transposase
MGEHYQQMGDGERHEIAALRKAGLSGPQIARQLGRHRTTIWREVRRNAYGVEQRYVAFHACGRARGHRRRSRKGVRFNLGDQRQVEELLQRDWSPEQVSGYLKRTGELSISHETIYRWLWDDRRHGGTLWQRLRGARKNCRKRYGKNDSRGRLAGKKMIGERPQEVESRERLGDWEIDTVHGRGKASVVTVVERKSGLMRVGKLSRATKEATTLRTIELLEEDKVQTITADNGCEFHDYQWIEEATGAGFYFANPHHAWERGSNENANGLLRQYLPKGMNLQNLSQEQCEEIAEKLNSRPRKRHNYRTPNEIYYNL